LRRQWLIAACLAALFLAAVFAWLCFAWGAARAARWLALAVPVAAWHLLLLRRNLHLNHPLKNADLFAHLGLANWLTLARGLLVAGVAGFLLLPRPPGLPGWAPAALYTMAIVGDLFDGMLARVTGRVTVLGGALDLEYDCMSSLIASALVVHYGQAPWWYLSWGLARYIFVFGLWRLKQRGRVLHEVKPAAIERVAAGLQMGFASVALWPLFAPPLTTLAAACFLAPLLTGFIRDWLVISGQVDAGSAGYLRVRQVYGWSLRWVPPILRVTAAVLAAWRFAPLLPAAFAVVALVAGACLLAGVLSRFVALALLAATCADVLLHGLGLPDALLVIVTIGLLYLGSGALALWPADDRLFQRRIGGPRQMRPVFPAES
jgi:CDP-diacylglycerol---glycerol-3-phosphate 3-phosphatidyltransferase